MEVVNGDARQLDLGDDSVDVGASVFCLNNSLAAALKPASIERIGEFAVGQGAAQHRRQHTSAFAAQQVGQLGDVARGVLAGGSAVGQV